MKPLELRDAAVLITGASSGIGRAVAGLVAAKGADLILVGRRTARLEELADTLRAEHDAASLIVTVDLADGDAATQVRNALETAGQDVDVLICAAGIGSMGAFEKDDTEAIARMVTVNATAHAQITRELLPGMIERRRGGVAFVASMAGLQPVPHMALYAATKAFLVHLADGLHHEVKQHGVRVSCVCPGPVRTEFFDVNDIPMSRTAIARAADADEIARFTIESLEKNRAVAIPGFRARLAATVASLLPRRLSGSLALRVMNRRLAEARNNPGNDPGNDG